jgi:glycosyltransferase involved in cell wall biosynthesis
MRLTVVIATWNRHEILSQTLEHLTRLVIPDGVEWEILVVNNNCTDTTDAVIASFAGCLPVVRLFEGTPGKSNALNLAVQEATGEYLLFADDDVRVEPDWIVAYHAAFLRWPDAAVFGGAVTPSFEGAPPTWLARALEEIGGVYGASHMPAGPIRLTDRHLPRGANMAVRADVQRRHLYDPRLGVWAGRKAGGEETAVVRAVLGEGLEGRWLPEARVWHFVPKRSQSIRYVRKFFFDRGTTDAPGETLEHGPRFLGRPLWVWRQAVEYEARYRFHRMFGRPEQWAVDLRYAATAWGTILGPARSDEVKGRPANGDPSGDSR